MHNFYGVRNKVDNFRKGLFLDPYDQPTYLTFALDFRFESLNGVSNDMLWTSPLFEKGGAANPNSAQTYLGSNGYKDKEASLAKFKSILEYLTFNAPWYFQSVQGISKLWANATDIKSGYKGNGAVIAVDTLEAIDLRITELANLYRSAIYDKVYMRELVPDNLRWFCMDIYVAEARNIRYTPAGSFSNMSSALGIDTSGINRTLTAAGAGLGSLLQNDQLDQSNPMKQFGYLKFKCRQCEFDFSESFAGGDTLNIDTSKIKEPNGNKFKINVGYFEEESEYHDSTKIADDHITNALKNPWSAMNLAANAQTRLGGASDLPYVGGFVDNGVQGLQEKLKLIGGLVNPALGAAFGGPTIKNIGDLYKGNNSYSNADGTRNAANFPRNDKSRYLKNISDKALYPDRFPNNDGDKNLGRIY
jgi:hypothetical protein